MSKQETFTVMHDKGEWINGVNIRPYGTFKSIMTPELEEKVEKGWLVKGKISQRTSSKRRK